VPALATGLGGFLRALGPGLQNAIKGSVPVLIELGKQLPGLGTGLAAFMSAIAKAAPAAVRFEKVALPVLAAILGGTGRLLEFLAATWASAERTWIAVGRRIGQVAAQVAVVWNTVARTAAAAAAGVRNAWNAAAAFLAGIPGRIRGFFNGIGSWFESVGRSIVAGVVSGIRGAIGSLASTAANMAKSALSAAKNALGIHSPSTAFAELGRQVVAGWNQGIAGGLPAPRMTAWSTSIPGYRSSAAGYFPAPVRESSVPRAAGPVELSAGTVQRLGEVIGGYMLRAVGLSGAANARVSDLYVRGG
jgi:hypothetical protein